MPLVICVVPPFCCCRFKDNIVTIESKTAVIALKRFYCNDDERGGSTIGECLLLMAIVCSFVVDLRC